MYRKLKGKMFENDIDQVYLAKQFKAPNGKPRSHFYVTERMTGKRMWDTEEIYTMCDLMEIPYEEIHIYFPRGGRDGVVRQRSAS